MVIRSPYPDLNIPGQDVLFYLFGHNDDSSLSHRPLWINVAGPDTHLSTRTAVQWIKRLAIGLDRLGLKRGDVLMMVSPNHIFVPVAYLGAVGSGRIFSGANPLYTVDGREDLCRLSCYGDCVQVLRLVVSTIGPLARLQSFQCGHLLSFLVYIAAMFHLLILHPYITYIALRSLRFQIRE